MNCLAPKSAPSTAASLTDWEILYKRFHTSKAARCEPNTLKAVGWYLLPLIREMEEQKVTLREFSDFHMEDLLAAAAEGHSSLSTTRRHLHRNFLIEDDGQDCIFDPEFVCSAPAIVTGLTPARSVKQHGVVSQIQ